MECGAHRNTRVTSGVSICSLLSFCTFYLSLFSSCIIFFCFSLFLFVDIPSLFLSTTILSRSLFASIPLFPSSFLSFVYLPPFSLAISFSLFIQLFIYLSSSLFTYASLFLCLLANTGFFSFIYLFIYVSISILSFTSLFQLLSVSLPSLFFPIPHSPFSLSFLHFCLPSYNYLAFHETQLSM